MEKQFPEERKGFARFLNTLCPHPEQRNMVFFLYQTYPRRGGYYQVDMERGSLGSSGHHFSSRFILFVRFQKCKMIQGTRVWVKISITT